MASINAPSDLGPRGQDDDERNWDGVWAAAPEAVPTCDLGAPPAGWRSWFPPTALVLVCWLTFANGIGGMFVFDDVSNITDNPAVQSLQPLKAKPKEGWLDFAPRRWVLYLSFALNYPFFGTDARGYHVVNIAIHMSAALALYGLVRRTLRAPRLAGRYGPIAEEMAFAAALIWMVHPIQTQSVTYVVQRTESLMGMFYILLFYCTVRGSQSPRPGLWYGLAVLSCLLGAFTKEVFITAPVLLYLYDAVFLGDSWFALLRRRWPLYVGCFAAIVPLVFFTFLDIFSSEVQAQGFGSKVVSSSEYARTQPEVILHYLKIIAWPQDLCLDHRWPVQTDFRKAVQAAVPIAAMVLFSLVLLALRRPVGLVAFAFFLILAPTSTFVPIIDLAFEHRLYVPLVAPVLLAIFGGEALLRRLSALLGKPAWVMGALAPGLVAVWAGMLSGRTIARNIDYQSDARIWADVIRQRPDNPRGFHNLAVAQEHLGLKEEALRNYDVAVESSEDPIKGKGHPRATYFKNYANLLARMGRNAEALAMFRRLTEFNSGYAEAYYGMGLQYVVFQDWAKAAENFEKACRLHKDYYKDEYYDVRQRYGEVLLKLGRWDEAVDNQLLVVAKSPELTAQRLLLARAQAARGSLDAAIRNFEEAIEQLSPPHQKEVAAEGRTAQAELAWLLATTNNATFRDGAAAEKLAREALAAEPVRAKRALIAALAEQGKFDEALELIPAENGKPDSEETRRVRELLSLKRPLRADPPSPGNPLGEPVSAPPK